MKRYIGIIIFLAIFFIYPYLADESTNWNPFDYTKITDVDYKAEVVDEYGSNGKVIITERLTFNVHAASENNLFWELWRDLPEEYIDGVKVHYNVNSVKQIFEDGRELVYEKSPKLYWYDDDYINTSKGLGPGKWFHSMGPYDGEYRFECLLFYVDGLYREKVVFEIEYEMYNAALRYNDYSELYLALYSGDTVKYLKSFKGEILFPDDKMPNKGNYDAYTYGTNSHEFAFTESDSKNPGYHTFSFELDESQLKFRPYNQYIEFALLAYGPDKHIFTQNASVNNYSNSNMLSLSREAQAEYEALPGRYQKIKILVFILLSAGTLLTIKSVFGKDKKIRKKNVFYEPAMQMDYFRDIPSELDPNFAATLVFSKHKVKDGIEDGYSAVMLSLVRKGYIELDKIKNERNWTSNNVKIIVKYRPINTQNLADYVNTERRTITVSKLKDADDSLNSDQKTWMNYLFRNGNSKQVITAFDEFYKKSDGLIDNYLKVESDITENKNIVPSYLGQPRQKKACPKCGNQNVVDAISCIFCSAPFASNTIISTDEKIDVDINSIQEEINANVKPLTPTEEQYFNLIIRHSGGTEITMSRFQEKISEDYQHTNSFIKNIKSAITNIGVSQGYFQIADYKKVKNQVRNTSIASGIFGILLLTLVNYISYQTRLDLVFGAITILGIAYIIEAIYLNKLSKKYILFTQFGEDEYAKWRGLYNFLNSETLMSERTVVELVIWEQYLIYATAFGISEKVIKALKVRCVEMNLDTSPVLRNPYYRSSGFYSHSHSFRSATRSASFTARSGGYGGYGGGGRGGGGGGGGH